MGLRVDVPFGGSYGENIKHTWMHTVLGISDVASVNIIDVWKVVW
jgi:hypothetical protein